MAISPQHRQLVDTTTDPPSLCGGECTACGHRFFPYQSHGCEKCGGHGHTLRPIRLRAEGVLLGSVVVRHHGGKILDEPFTLARVRLEPGIAVRAVLSGEDLDPPIGAHLLGTLVPIEGSEDVELRFRPVAP